MALNDLLATLERRGRDTPDTPCNSGRVSAKPAPIQACTRDTPDTPRNDERQTQAHGADVAGDDVPPLPAEPFARDAFEERAAIAEFDGGLSRDEAEVLAWHEDDRRRCAHCLNLLPNGVCKVAQPGGIVSANRGYRPINMLMRCAGYRPCPDDPDRRPGAERWQGVLH